jgi:hypothetical protein
MKLVYLKTPFGKLPSRRLEKAFDYNVEVIRASAHEQEGRVKETEDEMEDRGISPPGIDDFLLYPPELQHLGDVVAKNRLNAGMLSDNGELQIGDSGIELRRALRLPFKEDSDTLVVAPHDEEDFAITTAYVNKKKGNSFHILFVTNTSKEWREKRESVYRDVLGLEKSEYYFADIPDKKVHENRSKFEEILKEKLKGVTTVILPSYGSNFDHINALLYSLPIVEESGADIILGKSTQSIGLNPKIWTVLDKEHIDKVVSFYSKENFGKEEYVHQVRNLFAELPEPLNRYVAELKTKNLGLEVGAYGYQPMKLQRGYQIAHVTDIF